MAYLGGCRGWPAKGRIWQLGNDRSHPEALCTGSQGMAHLRVWSFIIMDEIPLVVIAGKLKRKKKMIAISVAYDMCVMSTIFY